MQNLFSLADKTAVITGSSRGIGRAIALAMAAAGARVVVSSRKKEACEEVAAEIRAGGGEAAVVPANVSDRAQIQALVQESIEAFGSVDIIVANAAANPVYGPMQDLDEAAFDKILDTNLKSSLWLAQESFPHMAERGGGCMIVISSITGMMGSRQLGAYAISKAADFQLVRNLALEWGDRDVRVNCVAPGLVKTDFARALWEDPRARAYVEKMTPLGRIGEPEDIAGVAVFLASPAAAFITGQTIVADGGAVVRDFV